MKKIVIIIAVCIGISAIVAKFIFSDHKSKTQKTQAQRSLASELETIDFEDQKYRLQWDLIDKVNGPGSKKADSIIKLMNKVDILNLARVTNILDSLGWPDAKVVGPNGHNTLFLVIQHGDLKTQLKYIPMFRKATENGTLQKSTVALMEDRILIGQGKEQIYGTQIGNNNIENYHFLYPLQNVDSVDTWRYRVGLGPIYAYLVKWDIRWDVLQYKRELPKIKKYLGWEK